MPALGLRALRVMLNPPVAARRAMTTQQDAVIGGPQAALRAFQPVVKG